MAGIKQAITDCTTEFSLDVYKQVVKSASDENAFLSPGSILVVMAMLHAGARSNTKDQMTRTLHFDNKTQKEINEMMSRFMSVLKQGSGSVTLKSANRLYPHIDKTILEEYITSVTKNFHADVKSMDYTTTAEAARQEINQWVEDETNKKIKNLLPAGSLNSLTAMVVVNAIYFKGNWATQFEIKATKKMSFHGSGGTLPVDMMRKEIKKAKYGESQQRKCKVLELPYEGEELGMMFILPDSKDGLLTLEQELTMQELLKLRQELSAQKVDVGIPKFKLESSFEMKKILADLGMSDMFVESKADFSGMGKDLYVSQVYHKAFIDVNEEGTEAAAATAAVMMKRSAPMRPTTFIADHPFMFLIWDFRLNAPLFIGRYTKPASEMSGKDEL